VPFASVGIGAIDRPAVTGVQFLELGQSKRSYLSPTIRSAIDLLVMIDDDDVVARPPDIDLEYIDTCFQSLSVAVDGVLRPQSPSAAMSDYQDFLTGLDGGSVHSHYDRDQTEGYGHLHGSANYTDRHPGARSLAASRRAKSGFFVDDT
jgi:hypothetical protein